MSELIELIAEDDKPVNERLTGKLAESETVIIKGDHPFAPVKSKEYFLVLSAPCFDDLTRHQIAIELGGEGRKFWKHACPIATKGKDNNEQWTLLK